MNKHIIMLVDDDDLILGTLKKRFETFDNQVYTASTEDEAKKILSEVTPEVLVLDLLLKNENGSSDILSFIRGESRLQNMVVLVLTNMDKPGLKDSLLAEGVKEYLIKGSIPIDELYEKVMGYLEPGK